MRAEVEEWFAWQDRNKEKPLPFNGEGLYQCSNYEPS